MINVKLMRWLLIRVVLNVQLFLEEAIHSLMRLLMIVMSALIIPYLIKKLKNVKNALLIKDTAQKMVNALIVLSIISMTMKKDNVLKVNQELIIIQKAKILKAVRKVVKFVKIQLVIV